jgi:hypothetical protein
MANPQEARITCSECNGWYVSERELHDHMQSVHRRFVSEPKNQSDTSNQEWAKLSVQLRNRVQVHFTLEELDAIDRFILLASQGSVFNHVCR